MCKNKVTSKHKKEDREDRTYKFNTNTKAPKLNPYQSIKSVPQ